MKCEHCDGNLVVANSRFKSEMQSVDVFLVQVYACPNVNCVIFAGRDLSNPTHTAKTVETKVT